MTFTRCLAAMLAILLTVNLCPAAAGSDDDTKKQDSPAKKTVPKESATKPPESKPGEKKDDAKPVDPVKEWSKLSQRKRQVSEKLQKLQKEFASGDDDRKRKIQDEFRVLLREFQLELYPSMKVLAPKIYARKPDDVDAAEFVMELEYQRNKYEQAARIADKLIVAKHNTRYVANVAGASHFALHNFEKAKKILGDADKKGHLDRQHGGQFLEPAGKYAEFWKKEQEIRKREADAEQKDQLPRVLFKTSRGDIEMVLYENEAPNTVANFISLVESKGYDGTKFHRVIPHFMAQGGDPNSRDDDTSDDGLGGPGYTIKCECYQENARVHFRGSLSMAHAGKDSGGSQFFITHLPTYWLNANKDAETGHTVFGRVVKGLDIAAALEIGDKIESTKVLFKRNHEYKPVMTQETKPDPTKDDGNSKDQGERN